MPASGRARAEIEGNYEGKICHLRCLPPEPKADRDQREFVLPSIPGRAEARGNCCVGPRSGWTTASEFSAQGPITLPTCCTKSPALASSSSLLLSPTPRVLAARSLNSPLRLPAARDPTVLTLSCRAHPVSRSLTPEFGQYGVFQQGQHVRRGLCWLRRLQHVCAAPARLANPS